MGWARPKPVARSFSQVPQVNAGAQDIAPSATAFPCTLAETWFASGVASFQTGTKLELQEATLTLTPRHRLQSTLLAPILAISLK